MTTAQLGPAWCPVLARAAVCARAGGQSPGFSAPWWPGLCTGSREGSAAALSSARLPGNKARIPATGQSSCQALCFNLKTRWTPWMATPNLNIKQASGLRRRGEENSSSGHGGYNMNLAVKPTTKGSWAAANQGGGSPSSAHGPPSRASGLGQGRPPWRDGAVSEQLHVYERLVQLAYGVLYT